MPQTGWTLVGPDRSSEFAELVRPHLELDPVRNTMILGYVARIPPSASEPDAASETAACYGWWTDDAGRVRAAIAVVHPGAVTLSGGFPQQAAAELPRVWQDSGRARPAGVFGPVEAAEMISAEWAKLTGGTYIALPNHAMRLFSFDDPTPPTPMPRGEARLATIDEVEFSMRWDVGFFEDCGIVKIGDSEAFVRSRIEEGRQMMWTVDGVPVAQATYTPVTAGSSRIIVVYTPPEHRRKGYAAALTWAITHEAQANGAEHVVLHTDLSNPTANAIYQRLGYRPVHDVTEFELAD